MNTQNINNTESKNGMSHVIIDMRPKVKHQDGHGREVLADVHFRINVQAYTANLYTYTKEAREESEKACEAYYSEVVALLKAEGWTLRKEKFGVGDCPQLVKGTQFLYCHPQDISGQVNPADIEALEAKIKALTSCKYYKTDNYGDIIVTTSESDEKQLYSDIYADGLGAIWQECTTTKRSNLYKDKAEAEHCVRRRICIANRRADLNDIGTGSYNMRTPLLQFLMEEYDRLLQAGYIKEATGQNGRTLCRWINKKEEKELNKARREAEKAEKERKAKEWQEFLDRETEKQNSFAVGMRVTVPAASLTDGEAFVIVTIRRKAADNGGNASLTVKNETTGDVRNINGSDVQDILPPLETASEITEADGDKDEDPTLTEAEKRDTLCRLWDAAWQQAQSDPEGTRVIVETNEEDPTAPANEFGRYYMVDGSESESSIEHAGQWVVIRVDTVTSPYEVHRPNWCHKNGYADSWTQLACRCENPNNVTRWARKMIDAGRVTDIYADCY